MSRRTALAAFLGGGMTLALAGGAYLSRRVLVRALTIRQGVVGHRVVHFSDIHHRGDLAYLRWVVDRINALEPDLVCFTGDLVEEARYIGATLGEIRRIACPVYGCPGNHDYTSGIDFNEVAAAFESTGGRWLVYEQVRAGRSGEIAVSATNFAEAGPPPDLEAAFNLHLGHYPVAADRIFGDPYDLLLAGHSHGGQVCIPFYGPPVLPAGVGNYIRGAYETRGGLLYVNPGIGTWKYPVRFNCRPEITVFEL